jgi:cystathionine beta-lyase
VKYNFDEIIPRQGSNCLKYDFARERGRPPGLLPLWVADMDFRTPPEVSATLHKLADHGIFGYTEVKPDYFEALRNWFSQNFQYDIEPSWLIKTPGVVFALALAVRAFTRPGDSVMIQQPVYYPFAQVVNANGRRLLNNNLLYEDGRYRPDLDNFADLLRRQRVKLFILCSPHNPVGRVWTVEELTAMGDICARHNCVLVSDEIHCDFVHQGFCHHVFASLSPQMADNSVICTSPSKSFNLAGLQVSNIFIKNENLREKFTRALAASGYSQLNAMGLAACQSAYSSGGPWLAQLRAYLAGNFALLREFIGSELPLLKLVEPEGTYLAWLDFRGLGLSRPQLNDLIINHAGLWLDDGHIFGPSGDGFQRINLACPRSLLQQALAQLAQALNTRGKLLRTEVAPAPLSKNFVSGV